MIIPILLFFTLLPKTFAQNNATPSAVPHVQYDLPYPGILPDNPLYFLKALRDNLLAFFITDPVKKAEYDLLMADKRLASAKSLQDEGKTDLAFTTLSKSGNYFYQAIQQAISAKDQGENADPIISRLIISSEKQQEVIAGMESQTKGASKANLELLQSRAKDFQTTAEALKP